MRLIGALLLLLISTTASLARPNIIVIMTDDQEDTGSTTYMPKTLSLIADEGITFKNSLVNLPLCAPSRASFLTGQAAHSHGIRANSPLDQGGWEAFKSKEENSLPVWLKAAGYKTALIGKYLNRYGQQSAYGAWLAWVGSWINVEFKGTTVGNPRDWVPPGWDLWYAFTGTRVRYYDYWINENGTILSFDHRPSDYSTDVLAERAVRFINDEGESQAPFFMAEKPSGPEVARTEPKAETPAPASPATVAVPIKKPEPRAEPKVKAPAKAEPAATKKRTTATAKRASPQTRRVVGTRPQTPANQGILSLFDNAFRPPAGKATKTAPSRPTTQSTTQR